jgi:hypothetical protein
MQCIGIASGGDRCSRDAGYGTDHDWLCTHHADQVVEPLVIGRHQVVAIGKNPHDIDTDAGVIGAFETVHAQFENGIRMTVDMQLHSTGHPAKEVQQVFARGDGGYGGE